MRSKLDAEHAHPLVFEFNCVVLGVNRDWILGFRLHFRCDGHIHLRQYLLKSSTGLGNALQAAPIRPSLLAILSRDSVSASQSVSPNFHIPCGSSSTLQS